MCYTNNIKIDHLLFIIISLHHFTFLPLLHKYMFITLIDFNFLFSISLFYVANTKGNGEPTYIYIYMMLLKSLHFLRSKIIKTNFVLIRIKLLHCSSCHVVAEYLYVYSWTIFIRKDKKHIYIFI